MSDRRVPAKLAITGATGFLGQSLLRLIAGKAEQVRALHRNPADAAKLRERGIIPIPGDLTVPGACRDLVEPGDVLLHLAARVDFCGSWSDFQKQTIEGTRHLLAAVLPKKPARVVYASSAGVYLNPATRPPVSADRCSAAVWQPNPYGSAKLLAENVIREECDRAGVSWSIVRLGFLYGPGNRAVLNYFIPLARAGKIYVVGRGNNRIASLYVDDAAESLLLAGTHPAAHRRIYDAASDECVTQSDYLNGTADAHDLPRPRKHVPTKLAYWSAGFVEWLCPRFKRPVPFTRAMVMLMGADQQIDATATRRELGWSPRTRFADGITRTAEWYRSTQSTN